MADSDILNLINSFFSVIKENFFAVLNEALIPCFVIIGIVMYIYILYMVIYHMITGKIPPDI